MKDRRLVDRELAQRVAAVAEDTTISPNLKLAIIDRMFDEDKARRDGIKGDAMSNMRWAALAAVAVVVLTALPEIPFVRDFAVKNVVATIVLASIVIAGAAIAVVFTVRATKKYRRATYL